MNRTAFDTYTLESLYFLVMTRENVYVAGNWTNQSFLGITSGLTELLSGQ